MRVKNSIRRLREAKGITQAKLADKLPDCITPVDVSLLENGHVLPTKETLDALCAVFECHAAELYDIDDLDIIGESKSVGQVSEELDAALHELGYDSYAAFADDAKRMLINGAALIRFLRTPH